MPNFRLSFSLLVLHSQPLSHRDTHLSLHRGFTATKPEVMQETFSHWYHLLQPPTTTYRRISPWQCVAVRRNKKQKVKKNKTTSTTVPILILLNAKVNHASPSDTYSLNDKAKALSASFKPHSYCACDPIEPGGLLRGCPGWPCVGTGLPYP
jgi:hypothetical protein